MTVRRIPIASLTLVFLMLALPGTASAELKEIWGPRAVDHPEHLWVLVGQLRKKIEHDPSDPRLAAGD